MVVANSTVMVSSVGSGAERSRDVVMNFCSSIIKIFLSPASRLAGNGVTLLCDVPELPAGLGYNL